MIQIRTEILEDRMAVKEVNTLAFEREEEANFVNEIRSSENFIPALSLVAIKGEEVVGHILFSRITVKTANEEIPILALAPMAVKPAFQNQGIGSRLVEEGLEMCRNTEYPLVVVLGHSQFYPRFGFSPARPKGIEPPFDVRDEVFMVIELKSGALEKIRGKVKYPPAFDQV